MTVVSQKIQVCLWPRVEFYPKHLGRFTQDYCPVDYSKKLIHIYRRNGGSDV